MIALTPAIRFRSISIVFRLAVAFENRNGMPLPS
jgi:hypothetical protein